MIDPVSLLVIVALWMSSTAALIGAMLLYWDTRTRECAVRQYLVDAVVQVTAQGTRVMGTVVVPGMAQ